MGGDWVAELRKDAAAHNTYTLHHRGARYRVIDSNLGYATPGELQWSKDADEATLRAVAQMSPAEFGDTFRNEVTPTTDSGRIEINPFWYHWRIIE